MMQTLKYAAIIYTFLMLMLIPSLHAGFIEDGVAVCTAPGYQEDPEIISDSAGGAIITWKDCRSGNYDIYAQRVDASGAVLWTIDGVPLCMAPESQSIPQIATDGAGGAIVTWQDNRSGYSDIYAQRVNAIGLAIWQTDGVPLCAAGGNQCAPEIVADGVGGAIVTWYDSRSGYSDIYAQRVNAMGFILWRTDGIPLCTASGDQSGQQIASDGASGAVVTWQDDRSGFDDIYAQRVDADGLVLWEVDGVIICEYGGSQTHPQITSTGFGEAVVTWMDWRNQYGGPDIYAQRVDVSGAVLWGAGGIPICTASGEMRYPKIISDGLGGAIVIWEDMRDAYFEFMDLYAQRVDAYGTVLWQTNGVLICASPGGQYDPEIISDSASGAIVAWHDTRIANYGVYSQRVNFSGTVLWNEDGIPLSTTSAAWSYPKIIADGSGGAFVTWQDKRSGSYDIYAARVRDSGEIVATLLQSYEALLEGGAICISWTLSEIDEDASFSVLRSSAPDWTYSEIDDARIEIDGLSFSFTDIGCLPGSTVKYHVDVSTEGVPSRTLFETDEITVPSLPVTLYQNHPNPFNPNTVIRFYLPEAVEVTLDINNVAGQRVVRLAEGRWESGQREVVWDGRNGSGVACSSGIYFYSLRAGKSSISRKMVLLR